MVTKEPNGDGNHQIMERLNKKTVINDQTIQYAPDKDKAYDNFEYKANI